MGLKNKVKKNKDLHCNVSVLLTDNQSDGSIDIGEIDMKITKLNSMIKNVERRITAYKTRLSNIYEKEEYKETRNSIQRTSNKISVGS